VGVLDRLAYSDGGGVVKLERMWVICPACGQGVEAVATDGQVRGYCAVAKEYVDFPIETESGRRKWWLNPEYRAKQSSARKKRWQDPKYRAKVNSACRGKHLTTETRAKLSKALKRWHNGRRDREKLRA